MMKLNFDITKPLKSTYLRLFVFKYKFDIINYEL